MKTFTGIEYENRKRRTKRENFLDEMDKIVHCADIVAIIHPYYYNNLRGRPACCKRKDATDVSYTDAV